MQPQSLGLATGDIESGVVALHVGGHQRVARWQVKEAPFMNIHIYIYVYIYIYIFKLNRMSLSVDWCPYMAFDGRRRYPLPITIE